MLYSKKRNIKQMPDLDFITLFNVVQIGFIVYYAIRSICILRNEKIRKLICKKCESKIYGRRDGK